MLKEELKELYKSKPELIDEHKRLVSILRSGSKKEQLEEAAKQLKELKEMIKKADRCWEGYKPVPGKKPYEKGSCEPVKKEEDAVSKIKKKYSQPKEKDLNTKIKDIKQKYKENQPLSEKEKTEKIKSKYIKYFS